ncbi:phage recombination protein Bet [mine drainage metagenome]|uniref:Phage recombination protein Bet n=1 Tax=mine drainage metagenome TaxID=410659 RepID=T1BGC4_9ZZZZ
MSAEVRTLQTTRICYLCHADIPAGTPLAWPDKAKATDAVWNRELREYRHGTDEGCGLASSGFTAASDLGATVQRNLDATPQATTTERTEPVSVSAPTPAPLATVEAQPPQAKVVTLNDEQITVLRAAGRFPADAKPLEIQFGLALASRYNLDVWSGQVKFIRFRSGESLTPYLGIEAFRALAERSGVYDGREITVVRDDSGKPVSATCSVYRRDRSRPIVEEVDFKEACRYTSKGTPTYAWETMPVTMLRKAAEERALRAAFPMQLSGLYGDAEVPSE